MNEATFKNILNNYSSGWDTKFKVSLGLNIILLLLLFFCIWQVDRICPPCAGEVVSVTTDTIRPKDKPVEVYSGKPVAVKKKHIAKPNKPSLPQTAIIPQPTEIRPKTDTILVPVENPCDYLRTYVFDTTVADNYHLIINEEVRGEITWRDIRFANLKPEVKTTVVKRIDKLKVYLGVSATYNARNIERWGIGPSATLAIDKIGEFGYGYDVKNNAHTIEARALLRFKK